MNRQRAVDDRFPAGLEDAGRDEGLEHGDEMQASGARADHRHSVPGTMIPGGPHPAAADGEWERIEQATKRSAAERPARSD